MPGSGRVEIRTDLCPVFTLIARHVDLLPSEVEDAWVAAGEHERQRPGRAMLIGIRERGIDLPGLPCSQINSVDAAAVDDIRIVGVRRDVVVLAARHDLVEGGDVHAILGRRPARHSRGAGVLLRTVHEVREPVVRDSRDRTARSAGCARSSMSAAIHRDERALIVAENLALGVLRIDPQIVEIVAGRIAL